MIGTFSASTSQRAELGKAETASYVPRRLRLCPPLRQLVLTRRLSDGGCCADASQIAAESMNGSQHQQVRDLAGPVTVSDSSENPVLFAKRSTANQHLAHGTP